MSIFLHLGKVFEVTRAGKVGPHMVMMPQLGVILPLDAWFELAGRLEAAGIAFDVPLLFGSKESLANSAQYSPLIRAVILSR
jgi:extradiol dioxygenase family protein